jgi:hypothetical protein
MENIGNLFRYIKKHSYPSTREFRDVLVVIQACDDNPPRFKLKEINDKYTTGWLFEDDDYTWEHFEKISSIEDEEML